MKCKKNSASNAGSSKKTLEHLLSRSEQLKKSINEIVDYLDYLKNKGDE